MSAAMVEPPVQRDPTSLSLHRTGSEEKKKKKKSSSKSRSESSKPSSSKLIQRDDSAPSGKEGKSSRRLNLESTDDLIAIQSTPSSSSKSKSRKKKSEKTSSPSDHHRIANQDTTVSKEKSRDKKSREKSSKRSKISSRAVPDVETEGVEVPIDSIMNNLEVGVESEIHPDELEAKKVKKKKSKKNPGSREKSKKRNKEKDLKDQAAEDATHAKENESTNLESYGDSSFRKSNQDAGSVNDDGAEIKQTGSGLTTTHSFTAGISHSSSSMDSTSTSIRKAGATSPSAVCQQRRLSPVVKLSETTTHELASGRPAIILPPLETDTIHRCTSESVPTATLSPRISVVRRGSCPANASPDYLADPAPLRVDAWSEPPSDTFQVRGPNYLKDRKKVPSDAAAFKLLTVDVVKADQPIMTGICAHPGERIQRALARERASGLKELPDFIFAVDLVVPGQSCHHSVFYFGLDDKSVIKDQSTAFGRIASQFFFGPSDVFRNETFKLIPRIVEGNILVRKSVGSKPAILGKKIKQTYVQTDRYLEVIVDIASDRIAQNIVKLSIGYAKTMVVDMGFVLEAADELTLPERLLGAVRMSNIDFKDRDGRRDINPVT